MSLVQPVYERPPTPTALPQAPFGAMVARQLSVWPFGARTARLFVLVDPSLPSQTLRSGLLRAMQQGYFASDGYSQTRAVREAALAAHYVLRHHNRDVLPLHQVTAASAVAAVRGNLAFVALAGHAAAFAWRNGELSGQRGLARLPRPLGLELDPAIALWRTPLMEPGDRLVLVCGASWRPDSEEQIRTILSTTSSIAQAEEQLAEVLGDARRASVLLVGANFRPSHLRLLPQPEPRHHESPVVPTQVKTEQTSSARWRWLFSTLGLLLLALVTLAALAISPPTVLPGERVDVLTPRMAVHLGTSAANVVDMAVGDDALYTLDVVEGAVRGYPLDGFDQQPGPETLLARAGTTVSGAARSLAQPVAIEYLPGAPGSLAIVDQWRTVAELTDAGLVAPELSTSASWQELGALGVGAAGELLFLDTRAHRLLGYSVLDQAVADPPRVLLQDGLPFGRVAQVIGEAESVVARLDDGTVQRLDLAGTRQDLRLPAVAGHSSPVSAIASDRAGGLFLADPLDARVVQTRLDGTLIRQLRSPLLAGARAIGVTMDGRRLFALVATGVLVADIPAL